MPRHPRAVAPTLLALAILGLGFPALDRYNVTWDEALGDFFFGERYLSFFASGLDPRYLDFAADPYPAGRAPDLSLSPFKVRPWEYYPVANTLAAATSELLSRRLGLLDPFDGFHALDLLLAALLVAVLHPFLARRWGGLAATGAVVLLFTAPRVVFHLMANVKDFPLLVIFSLTAIAGHVALERGSLAGLLGAGALWGLALGTKANAVFLPAIPLLVLAAGGLPATWRGRRARLALGLVGAVGLGLAVLVAVWPYLWAAPWERLGEHLRYVGLRRGITRPESVAPVFQAIVLTTPPAFLALWGVGLGRATVLARRRDRLALFFLAWQAVVLGRYLLPQAVNFDGVRHFLELFPAMAATAGLGLAWLVDRLVASSSRVRRHPRAWVAGAVVLALLPGGVAVARSHPFEIAYWNVFAGGYAGARERGLPQASDYWGSSYRLGLEWLNQHAEPGALLAVPVVEHAVRLVAPLRLRADIVLLPVTTPLTPRIAPERLRLTREAALRRPLYVMFVDRRDWRNELMVDCLTGGRPLASWSYDGAPVLEIYRYGPAGCGSGPTP